MSLLKTIKQQLGQSVTPANNFTLDASADNGTVKLARGNADATTQDILTVDAAGNVKCPVTQPGDAPVYGVRAWASWTGSTAGTNAPTAGGNVSTVTRNSAGDYTVTFTTAMPHANYAVSIGIINAPSINQVMGTVGSKLAGSFRFTTVNAGVAAIDPTQVTVQVVA